MRCTTIRMIIILINLLRAHIGASALPIMFPIIPYNLHQHSRTMSATDTRSTKVSASCDIPRDTVSEIIRPSSIRGKLENQSAQLQVGLNEDNLLSVASNARSSILPHWIRLMRLADDCHGYNARLCYQKPGNECCNLVIQITRPIKTGQELLLWFSEDVLANLQMAFLTPVNIQGQKKYVCHLCSTTFEYPNPLKLHLTLDCNRQHISTIWDRLYKSVSPIKTESSTTSFGFQLKMIETKYSILNLSKSPDIFPTPDLTIQRPVSEPSTMHSSAFKPYSTNNKISQNNNSIRLSQSVTNLSGIYQSQPTLLVPNSYSNPADLDHAAQMETLVSNLGKSKQGHLCIYCGKCYSRKYGLKIHIRTHTGYKPLKCKFCLRPFGDPSNLNKHVRLHAEGDTPYKCELCGKVLVRRRDLERHLRSRHMEEMHLGEKVDVVELTSSDHSDD